MRESKRFSAFLPPKLNLYHQFVPLQLLIEVMAGVLEEFDEATPLRGTYCSRLTAEEYEEQGSACTEQALAELLKHLDRNPQVYKDILSKKKKQEQEEAGLLSYVKVFSLSRLVH